MANRKNFTRYFTAATVLTVLLLMVWAPAHAKTFKWAFQSDAGSMDPYTMNNTMTLGFTGNIYEGLVRHDKNEAIEPCLATDWKTIKPDVWRFSLRKNVTFHDGTPFTAEDVIFSWKRAISQGSDMKSFVNGIKDIVKVDDHTVDIVTNGPWSQSPGQPVVFISTLACIPSPSNACPRAVATSPDARARQTVPPQTVMRLSEAF